MICVSNVHSAGVVVYQSWPSKDGCCCTTLFDREKVVSKCSRYFRNFIEHEFEDDPHKNPEGVSKLAAEVGVPDFALIKKQYRPVKEPSRHRWWAETFLIQKME
jgi:hypothetical protein